MRVTRRRGRGDREGSLLNALNMLAGMESNVTQVRTLIASLEAGLAFSKAMSRALPLITQLLASSTLSDTQEAISLLIMCSKFGISGSDSALRKILPLVFCPEQGACPASIVTNDAGFLKDIWDPLHKICQHTPAVQPFAMILNL